MSVSKRHEDHIAGGGMTMTKNSRERNILLGTDLGVQGCRRMPCVFLG